MAHAEYLDTTEYLKRIQKKRLKAELRKKGPEGEDKKVVDIMGCPTVVRKGFIEMIPVRLRRWLWGQ